MNTQPAANSTAAIRAMREKAFRDNNIDGVDLTSVALSGNEEAKARVAREFEALTGKEAAIVAYAAHQWAKLLAR